MLSSPTFWLAVSLCLLAGFAIGWLLNRRFDSSQQRVRELEKRLADSDSAIDDYRRQVTEHFRGTAERVNRLTENYRELHAHLSSGAHDLCRGVDDGSQIPLLTSLGGKPAGAQAPVSPPLDYAPKRAATTPQPRAEDLDLDRIHDT